MSRLFLMVLVTAVLVAPATASAMRPDYVQSAPINARGTDVAADFRSRGGSDVAANAKTRAVEAYYASYGTPKPIAASSAPEPVADVGGLSLGTVGIGIGLMLLAGGLGVYAGRSIRPRHIGA